MQGFELAILRFAGWTVGFATPATATELVARSKSQRDRDGGEYLHEELLSADHPYRRLFSEFSHRLRIAPGRGQPTS
jgi:hypothetical protein